jgi:hypothetical protein
VRESSDGQEVSIKGYTSLIQVVGEKLDKDKGNSAAIFVKFAYGGFIKEVFP